MKKIVAIIGLIICFVSCNRYNDSEPSAFVVKQIGRKEGMVKCVTYEVQMLDASGIGSVNFLIVDTVGKYKVGDLLVLKPYKR